MTINLALFASGNGSNAQAIIDAVKDKKIKAHIQCIVCDNKHAYVIERARDAGINCIVVSPKEFANRKLWEQHIVNYLLVNQVDLIVLAGFMRIIKDEILGAFPKRIINIHPSMLPAFPGRNGILDAFQAKVKETGVTIHYVDEGIDTGEIIAQESLTVEGCWTLDELEAQIHAIEHRLYPIVIQQVIEDIQDTTQKG